MEKAKKKRGTKVTKQIHRKFFATPPPFFSPSCGEARNLRSFGDGVEVRRVHYDRRVTVHHTDLRCKTTEVIEMAEGRAPGSKVGCQAARAGILFLFSASLLFFFFSVWVVGCRDEWSRVEDLGKNGMFRNGME